MGFLLKIVEGPNRGAEIALPEGVPVSLGKGDDCDVILADATLPDEPMTFNAAPDGVTLDGVALEPFLVATRGATAFAVGPSDAPWGALKWPEAEKEAQEEKETPEEAEKPEAPETPDKPETPEKPKEPEAPAKRRGGLIGCLVALAVLLVALAALAWVFRGTLRPFVERYWNRSAAPTTDDGAQPGDRLADIATRHGVALTNRADRPLLVGNFKTRAERLVATAEAYAAQPGVDLDFSDDESLKTGAEDMLALLSEAELRVAAATNRVVALSGKARHLKRTLEAFAADLTKLDNVDVSDVRSLEVSRLASLEEEAETAKPESREAAVRQSRPQNTQPANLPVCGILTTPYPCLVLRSGARVLEGATVGDSVVVKIEADSVTLTNSTGRFTWKP